MVAGQGLRSRYVGGGTEKRLTGRAAQLCRRGFQPRDQLVEPKLLQTVSDRVQLARRELDQALPLLTQLERLAQPGLVRVEPPDDLLEPLHGGLVAHRLGTHLLPPSSSSITWAPTLPSASRMSKWPASRTAAAVARGSPPSSSTSA